MQLQQVLDGRLAPGTGDDELVVTEPATGTVLAAGPAAGPRDVDAAVRAAHRAHDKAWARVPGMVRTRAVLALADALEGHRDELATLEARDTGTPRHQVLERDLAHAHRLLEHHAGWADKLAHLGPSPDPRALGVSVHLLPAVASVADVLAEVAPALAAGCTVLVLAPEVAPLATLALGRLGIGCGLPAGVLNVLAGPVRAELVAHRDVAVLSVTGPARAVVAVRRALVGSTTVVRARVHGDDVVVALDPAAVDEAVEHALGGVAAHGRRLGGGARLVVPAALLDDARDRLRAGMSGLAVGDPLDPSTDVGPSGTGGFRTPQLREDSPAGDAPAEESPAGGGPLVRLQGFRTGDPDGDRDPAALVAAVGTDPHTRVRLVGGDPGLVRALRVRLRGTVSTDGATPACTSPREYLR